MAATKRIAGALVSGKAAPRFRDYFFTPQRNIHSRIWSGNCQTIPSVCEFLIENGEAWA